MDQYSHNKQLSGSQSALLEVLEVPQLMDTCVRNGIYDEALDLQAFVSRMGLLHPDIPAVRMLMKQVGGMGPISDCEMKQMGSISRWIR